MLAGQRIARSFSASSDSDGDTVQRATIVGVQDVGQTIDDDWYLGLYDDGRTEELQVGSAIDYALESVMCSH